MPVKKKTALNRVLWNIISGSVNGYLDLSKQYPARIKVIKVDADKEEIFKRVKLHIDALLDL